MGDDASSHEEKEHLETTILKSEHGLAQQHSHENLGAVNLGETFSLQARSSWGPVKS